MPFSRNRWYDVRLDFDCAKGKYSVQLNGKAVREVIDFDAKVTSLELLVFRTGSWRDDVRQYYLDGEPNANGLETEDLAGAGERVPESVFWIDNVKTSRVD